MPDHNVCTAIRSDAATPPNKPAERSDGASCMPDGNWLCALAAHEFIAMAQDGTALSELLAKRHAALLHQEASEAERTSWSNSLPALAGVLQEAQLHGQLVILEYCPPSRDELPNRIDAVICGADSYGNLNAVCIELKQWAAVDMREDEEPGFLLIKHQGEWQRRRHPRKQVEDYRQHMRGILKACDLSPNFLIFGAYAYMHNARNLPRRKKRILFGDEEPFDCDSRLYTGDYAGSLAKRLRERTGNGEGARAFAAFREVQERAVRNIDKLPMRAIKEPTRKKKKSYPTISGREWRDLLKVFCAFVLLPATLLLGLIAWLIFLAIH